MFESLKRIFKKGNNSVEESTLITEKTVMPTDEHESVSEDKITETHNNDSLDNNPALQEFRRMMQETMVTTLSKMPIWMRLNYFNNMISMHDGDDSNVNWDKINELLIVGIDTTKPYYNICGKIRNIQQLRIATVDSRMAFVPEFNMPYYRQKCKQCGKNFELTRGEINFFEKKNLNIPHRCYKCRKGIQSADDTTVKMVTKTEVEEEPCKTAMQLAMEKAGVI